MFFVVLQMVCFRTKKKREFRNGIDAKTKRPLAYVVVSIQNTNAMQLTASNGKFNFDDLIVGDQLLLFTVRATRRAFSNNRIGATTRFRDDNAEEDEILDQQRSLTDFRK
jgi:hypothetical protein